MEKRNFLKGALLTTGSLLLGGAIIHHLQEDEESAERPFPPAIESVHQGNKRNVLVVMSADMRLGNTDRLTDAYIKGLAEAGHSVTKVFPVAE